MSSSSWKRIRAQSRCVGRKAKFRRTCHVVAAGPSISVATRRESSISPERRPPKVDSAGEEAARSRFLRRICHPSSIPLERSLPSSGHYWSLVLGQSGRRAPPRGRDRLHGRAPPDELDIGAPPGVKGLPLSFSATGAWPPGGAGGKLHCGRRV
jgi:hypothetical protein